MYKERQAIVVTDLGFGDAGKGTIVDYLTRRYSAHTVVRYNGGPQAAHTVVCSDGRYHTFSQFVSGMFVPETQTLLSRFMLINPLNMLKEARHLQACGVPNALQRVQIDRRALVITPFQRAMNRLREIARAGERHGSCGEGVGECMADSLNYGYDLLCAGDLAERDTIRRKLQFMRAAKLEELAALQDCLPQTEDVQRECAIFHDSDYLEVCQDVYLHFSDCVDIIDETAVRALFAQPGTLIFEGAQGILLDENYGFAPYTTWSTTTCANADELLEEHDYAGQIIRLGVMRTYATRHGAGPFPTADHALASLLPEPHNPWNSWQREFRVGHSDLVMTRYSRDIAGNLDCVAITHADRLADLPEWRVCTAYRYRGESVDLSPYFEHSADNIHALRIQRPPNLGHQEQLTHLLQSCVPAYHVLAPADGPRFTSGEQAACLSWFEEALSLPITITSYGPTAEDKEFCQKLGLALS